MAVIWSNPKFVIWNFLMYHKPVYLQVQLKVDQKIRDPKKSAIQCSKTFDLEVVVFQLEFALLLAFFPQFHFAYEAKRGEKTIHTYAYKVD